MADRPLTREEFEAAGIPLEQCMTCPRQKGRDEYGGWKYFRFDGALTILCPDCYRARTGPIANPVEVLAFLAQVRDMCGYPIWADSLIPAKRSPREWVEYAIANFREMTSSEIDQAESDCLRDPPPGQPDERRIPPDLRKVLRCLRYTKEASDASYTKMLNLWKEIDSFLASWIGAEEYVGYRERVKATAAREAILAFNELLTDELRAARHAASKKKTKKAKEKALRKAIDDTRKWVESYPVPGAADDFERFVEFIESDLRELDGDGK
jgi:hypothetical protein